MKNIKTILYPTDFSRASAYAWRHALIHAQRHNAKIVIVHVIHRMPKDYQFLIVAMAPAQIHEMLKEKAEKKMRRLAEGATRKGLRCQVLIRDGAPFVQIIRCAKELRADMIVMGSHGQTGLAQTLLGSTAEKVVRKAPCPVLVIKHPMQKFRMP